ncbi:MAG: DUF4625 domain-containing protein [Flavobacteriales bacterium]|nr:DUF4625 domain-containing protein [Flavobacteriales bacterium]
MHQFLRYIAIPTITVGFSLIFLGCKKFDENKPEVLSISINESSMNELYAHAGESNHMVVRVADDQSLSQVMVKFTANSGLHDHSDHNSPHVFTDYNQGAWDTVFVSNISGKEAVKEYVFEIPDDVSGGWNLEISALDEAGNLVSQEKTVHIMNLFQPSISISHISHEADEDNIIHALTGEIVSIEGIALDADSLAYVKAHIYRNTTQIWTEEFSTINDAIFDLSILNEPVLDATGTYYYDIEAEDLSGYYTKVRAMIKVN